MPCHKLCLCSAGIVTWFCQQIAQNSMPKTRESSINLFLVDAMKMALLLYEGGENKNKPVSVYQQLQL